MTNPSCSGYTCKDVSFPYSPLMGAKGCCCAASRLHYLQGWPGATRAVERAVRRFRSESPGKGGLLHEAPCLRCMELPDRRHVRTIVRRVHPDLFSAHPRERSQNSESLKVGRMDVMLARM
jgi:hypothetical protein